jgi:hypothetical protein
VSLQKTRNLPSSTLLAVLPHIYLLDCDAAEKQGSCPYGTLMKIGQPMKQYLLFAGARHSETGGVNGLAGEFDSVAEAVLSLVDRKIEWWHVLDIQTGEVTERHHIRIKNGVIGFQKSDRILGQATESPPILPPANGLDELEVGLQSVAGIGIMNESGSSGRHANGADEN